MSRSSILSALLVSLCAACSSSPATNALRMEVETSVTQIATGEAVTVTVRAINEMSHTVHLSHGGCFLGFTAYTHDGSRVTHPPVCQDILLRTAIPSGDTVSATLTWRTLSNRPGTLPLVPLVPGTYRVVGELRAVEGRVTSPPATVVVLPE